MVHSNDQTSHRDSPDSIEEELPSAFGVCVGGTQEVRILGAIFDNLAHL